MAALTAWQGGTAGFATEALEIELLLEAVLQRFGFDFRDYDRPALRAKLHAVMQARGLATVSGLQERVLHEAGAAAALLRALSVTPAALFDDPDMARQLRLVLGPALRASAVPKVWLADCAGIGEAWSLAILLSEEAPNAGTEIFATVANEDLLAEVHAATLPAARLEEYHAQYASGGGQGQLQDYFEIHGDAATLLPRLRTSITWAQYNLVTDASFNEFQAIICRRALRDFGPVLRQRVLRLFHDSLSLFGIVGIDREFALSDVLGTRYQQVLPRLPWYKRIA
jgi:chemotaxis protein methyltransferase CheR